MNQLASRSSSPQARSSLVDGRACFIGSTLVDTNQGRMQIADLARLSTDRDNVAAGWQRTIDDRQAQLDAQADGLQQANDAMGTATGVFLSFLQEMHARLTSAVASLTAGLARDRASCDAHVSGCLPQLRVRNADTGEIELRNIASVVRVADVTDVVDINLGSSQPLTCTPSQVFITTSGDVEAPNLVAHSVQRISVEGTGADPLAIVGVSPRTLENAVPVYDVIVEGSDSFAVAVDGSNAAVCVRSGGGQ